MGTPSRLRSASGTARTLLELVVIAAAVWAVGARAHAFTGQPKGNDATGHLSKARFILDNWPHVSWNDQWYGGQPTFAGSYPPGYHVLLAGTAWAANISLATAMNILSYGSVLLVVAGLYAAVRGATGSRVGGLVAAGLLAGTPTLWAQVVVLGLYPRLAALGLMSVAVAVAVGHTNRGGHWRGALTGVLLALCLSLHPIVGVIGVGLVGGVYLLDPRHTASRRLQLAFGPLAGAFGLVTYFYLPLGTSSRSQSLFTDTETSLSWGMLFRPVHGHLDGLTPLLLPLGMCMVGLAVRRSIRPEVPFAEKVALRTEVAFLSTLTVDSEVPVTAGPATRRFVSWFKAMQVLGLAYRLAMLFALGAAGVFGYGLIGLAVDHFPWYVNGLQPADLLVYPAYLLSGVIGLMLTPVRVAAADWLVQARFGRATWVLRTVVTASALATCASVVGASAWGTAQRLKPVEWTNADVPTRASVLPAEADGQHQFRFAGGGDITSEWVNNYSSVPQVRGYDDHGALHLDWQSWLEGSLLQKAAPATERRFLLDWYGVKWVDTDAGIGDQSQFDGDQQHFAPLVENTSFYFRIQTYRYRDASPIVSATSVPAILVVGDDQHYDLMLRALALSGFDSRRLIPVHGPASLDAVTPELLSSFQGVALYGATVGHPARDASMLGTFVRAGRGLFVDGAEDSAEVAKLVGVTGSPLPVAAVRATEVPDAGWAWTAGTDSSVVPGDLPAFGPPAFGSSHAWSTETAAGIRAGAHVVLATYGKTVAAAGPYGKGRVFWEGLNLPYHLATFRSGPEAAFLGRALLSTTTAAAAPIAQRAAYVDPQHWQVTATGARGVLVKEQDAPGWHATVNGRHQTIYPAGPGMMWIPVPSGSVQLTLRYRLSAVEKLGYTASLTTLVVGLVFLLNGRLRRRLSRRATDYWWGSSAQTMVHGNGLETARTVAT
jgi:hypothetical protein